LEGFLKIIDCTYLDKITVNHTKNIMLKSKKQEEPKIIDQVGSQESKRKG